MTPAELGQVVSQVAIICPGCHFCKEKESEQETTHQMDDKSGYPGSSED